MRLSFCFFLCLSFIVISCKPAFHEPQISLEEYRVEEGFELEMVASEPLLTAPVAIDFDSKGRIWVAEMAGFMVNLEGDGEDLPSGSIKILEDLDNDGIMDHAKTFLDSLVMPRALALVYGGLLYAESPNLWFVDIENDKPVNRVLVDSLYATVGNPEHQPNGLMMNLDNWIYNAKSNFRYQRKDGVWKKEPTTGRGQWGITHDNFGRLYYNTNSTQLMGDHVLPNRLVRNKYFVPRKGVDETLTQDNRVYPLHAASVNRGYEEGVLNEDGLLVNVTASCGPLVYRGGVFPSDYDQNVFVCVPEANVIKRNILSFDGDRIEAKQAYQGKEFLASTDEGFRPVNLSNGPDGNMYVVDMHRGVIQHYAFLSPYLKKISGEKKLDTILDYGRILRVGSKDKPAREIPDLETLSASQLLAFLKDSNGWVRDKAQQYLIHNNDQGVVPELKKMALDNKTPLAQLHALYVLKGLNALSFNFLEQLAQNGDNEVASHAIVLMEDFTSETNVPKAKVLFAQIMKKNEPMLDLYLSSTLGIWANYDQEVFFPFIYELSSKYTDNAIVQEAILSGSEGVMSDLNMQLEQMDNFKNTDLEEWVAASLKRKKDDKPNNIYATKVAMADSRTNGAILFRQICASCHSTSGEGIQGLAPPLVGSDYIANHLEQLGLIILHGLKGPLVINGELYDNNHQMPGLKYNKNLSDKDISDIISYVTNAFSVNPKGLKPEKIKELRSVMSKDSMEYTEKELYERIGK